VMSAPVGHRGRGAATSSKRASPGTRESRRAATAHSRRSDKRAESSSAALRCAVVQVLVKYPRDRYAREHRLHRLAEGRHIRLRCRRTRCHESRSHALPSPSNTTLEGPKSLFGNHALGYGDDDIAHLRWIQRLPFHHASQCGPGTTGARKYYRASSFSLLENLNRPHTAR
jgi:hypothetical protein